MTMWLPKPPKYNFLMRLLLVMVWAAGVFACSRYDNKFQDPVFVQIAEYQDHRLADSLIGFLSNKNYLYRKEAALALASVQDSTASAELGERMVEDSSVQVKLAAAFALGQTGGSEAVHSLTNALKDKDSQVVKIALEALGKIMSPKDLPILYQFHPKDSLATEGLLWAYYRLGLRGMADSTMIDRATIYLSFQYPLGVRLAAAHFFARSNIIPKKAKNELIKAAQEDPLPEVRMAAVNGLRKIEDDEVTKAVSAIVANDKDYRVRINAVRACAPEEWNDVLIYALSDSNVNVAVAAAEIIGRVATVKQEEEIRSEFSKQKNERVRALLGGALIKVDTANQQMVVRQYQQSKNNYEKAALLIALSSNVNIYPFIFKQLIESKVAVIKTAAAQALVTINRDKAFIKENRKIFAKFYKQAIADGDAGVISILTQALADTSLRYKEEITDVSFLREAKAKLQLPRDYEAMQPLEEAIAVLTGKEKPQPPKSEYNHPIDWKKIKVIPNDQRIKLITSKGEVILRMLVEESPGSVLNFFELTRNKYFDGKYFHRVVPNFVIQTGCNRGDGFGSEAYSIRSEFGWRPFAEGSVGMASAGKDTEGTQWFITHSPTPHLEGRYTLFAKVERGMDVVHRIEVGDFIETAVILE